MSIRDQIVNETVADRGRMLRLLDAYRDEVRAEAGVPELTAALLKARKRVAALEAAAGKVRATVLREAADVVGNDDTCYCGGCDTCVPRQLADELRRMAAETAPADVPACTSEYGGPGYTHCELAAGHDGEHESAIGNMRRATWGDAL